MGMWELFGNLTKGEITPYLGGQQNLETYYNGLASGKNMWGLPQGGQQKRHGNKYIDLATGNARLENFSFNTEQEYLMVFTATGCRIYKDDVALRTGLIEVYDDTEEYAIGDVVSQAVTAGMISSRWETTVTQPFSFDGIPVERNGFLYVTFNGTPDSGVACIRVSDGVKMWEYLGDAVTPNPIIGGLRSKVAVDDTGVYFYTPESSTLKYLTKIDLDGVFVWKTQFRAIGTTGNESPIVIGDYVYISSGNTANECYFMCCETTGGVEQWYYRWDDSSALVMDGVPVEYYDATNDRTLIVIGGISGLWYFNALPTAITDDTSSITNGARVVYREKNIQCSRTCAIKGDYIYNGYYFSGGVYHYVSKFELIDDGGGIGQDGAFRNGNWGNYPANWEELWNNDVAVGDNFICVGSHETSPSREGVWGIIRNNGEADDGDIAWGSLNNYYVRTNIVAYNDLFAFGDIDSGDGKVRVVNADDGTLLWDFTFDTALEYPENIEIAGNYLYVGTTEGIMYQFDMSLIALIGQDAIFYVKADFIFWDEPVSYIPNQLVMSSFGGVVRRFRCTNAHVSETPVNKPMVGGNWALYWILETDSFQPISGTDYEHYFFLLEGYAEDAIIELPSAWTWEQIEQFDYIQSLDTIIITQEDVPVTSIQRFSDEVWIIEDLSLSNIPQFDFNDGQSPLATAEIQTIIFPDSDQTGDRFKISLNGLLTEEIVYSRESDSIDGGNATTTENNIKDALVRLASTGNDASDITVECIQISGSRRYQVTFDGGSANDWDLMAISYVYAGNTTTPETRTERDQEGTSRKEDTWSPFRGYPRTCTFHEGRLYFGGSRDRRNTVWGSRVFDYFNFWVGRAFPDESIEATLDTDQSNAINGIFSNRSLQVFTSGNEFYVPTSPITPEKVEFSPQSNVGAKLVKPVTIDGITLFVQLEGKSIIQFVYLDSTKANESSSISSSSEQLISNPKKMVVRKSTSGRDANYVLIVNDDGTLAVFCSMSSQGVAGFTPWETAQDSQLGSRINSCAVTDNYIYTLVQREVDNATIYVIEKEDPTAYVDSAITGTPTEPVAGTARLSGLDHLEGETVYIRADGAYFGTAVVDASGQAEWTYTQTSLPSSATAGLLYLPEVIPMPLNVNLPNGVNAFSKKKIARVALNLLNSNGVRVNGNTYKETTDAVTGIKTPLNGVVRKHVLGWSLEAQPTIDQVTPEPLTILSIGLEVAT